MAGEHDWRRNRAGPSLKVLGHVDVVNLADAVASDQDVLCQVGLDADLTDDDPPIWRRAELHDLVMES